jgi:hypothetical protein
MRLTGSRIFPISIVLTHLKMLSLTQMLRELLSTAVKKKCKEDKDLLKAFMLLPRFPTALYDELLGLCLAFVQTSMPQRSESLRRMTITQGRALLDWRSGWLSVFKKKSSFNQSFCILDEDAHTFLCFYYHRLRPIAGTPNLPSPHSNMLVHLFMLVQRCGDTGASRQHWTLPCDLSCKTKTSETFLLRFVGRESDFLIVVCSFSTTSPFRFCGNEIQEMQRSRACSTVSKEVSC